MRQFGDRDQELFNQARIIEQERALREQQDREYQEALEQDRLKELRTQEALSTQYKQERHHDKVIQELTNAAHKGTEPTQPLTKEELRRLRIEKFDKK